MLEYRGLYRIENCAFGWACAPRR